MPDARRLAEEVFAREGLRPHAWSNDAGFRYGWHAHDYDKVLFCVAGSITFHTPDGEAELRAGDRLDLPAGTEHAATVGPGGVSCLEAGR